MHPSIDTLVIGAGQAGLAAGYHLQRAGHSFTILEASAQPGGSWPHYYESLRLFSPARFSSLPGLRFPGDPERYPARDEVIAYLRDYATHFQLPIVGNTRVARIIREHGLFAVQTDSGQVFQAHSLIAATGAFHRPHLPILPGQELFGGSILHSYAYQNPTSFEGQRVVIVGAGNSAVQIATELARVADVSLATRAPVRFIHQRPYGRDVHFWWWLTRLDRRPLDSRLAQWLERHAKGTGPRVLDTGVYRAALAAGRPAQQPMFSRFTENGVAWDNGHAEPVGTVIFATGYRPNLDYLESLGALDADGRVLQQRGVSLTVPGLYFVGLSNQRTYASATLRGVGPDAAVVVRHLTRQFAAPALKGWAVGRRLFHRQNCCPARQSPA
jgi:putative flavoprotein involved in K+ transport